jgi:hypothetical protein
MITKKISLAIICFFLFNACKKKAADPVPVVNTPAPVVMNGSMTALLNGASWTSTKNTGQLVIDNTNNLSALVLNGETSANIFALGIDFPTASTNIAVDTHDFGLTKDDALISYSQKTAGGGFLSQHIPDEGTLNITAVDNVNKKISGTFSCIMHKSGSTLSADSIKITNGVFTNITYVVQ